MLGINMEKLLMCRICLVQNVRMFVVVNETLRELYEKLTDIPFVTEDSRPILACFFCCAQLKQCYRLRRKCLEAEELFTQMMNEDYQPKPLINQDHLEFCGGFINSPIVHISIDDECQTESIAIKEELPAVCEGLDDNIEPEEEHQCHEDPLVDPESLDNGCLDQADIAPHHSEADLEDDRPLMEFETEVENEEEVSKKKRRAKLTKRATAAKKPKLNTRRTKQEDAITAEQIKIEKSDSIVIRRTQKPRSLDCVISTRNLIKEERNKIIDLHRQGLNISQIAVELNLQRTTVRRWVRRYEEGEEIKQRVRAPRRRAINKNQLSNMIATYEESPYTPTRSFAEDYEVSMQTIRNELRRAGLHHKNILTEEQKVARVQFARDYRDFDFTYAIFSDEKCFKSSQQCRRNVWRIDNTRYEPRNVIPNAESGRVNVNFWGWMSAAGPGELTVIPGKINGHTYLDVLQDIMVPTVRTVYTQLDVPEFYFFQDNCPIHRTRVVQDWLRGQPQIRTVSWPSQSPDLNPFENLWGLMVQKWDNSAERTKEALVSHCEEVWDTLRGSNLCEVLVRSMRSRCDAVIDAGGEVTKLI